MSSPITSAMSVSSSRNAGDRIISVKSNIRSIGWREENCEQLLEVVDIAHATTGHSFSFSKYIFLNELQTNQDFDITVFLNSRFFSGVWLSLVEYERRALRLSITIRNRDLLSGHLPGYLQHANYMRPYFPHVKQCSIYEGRRINSAYSNNINMRFGQHLKRSINSLLDIRGRKAAMERALAGQGLSAEEISGRIRENVIEPARRFKLAINSRQVNTDRIGQQLDVFGEALQALLSFSTLILKTTHFKQTISITTASPGPPTT